MNTFEMTDAIKFLKSRLDNGEGDPKTLADTIESLKLDRDEKVNSSANWYEENNSKIDWATKKIKELQTLKKHYENINKSLDYYFDQVLKNSGQSSIMTEDHVIEWGRKSTRVEVPDAKKLPIDYVVRTESIKADKKKIKEDLAKGKEIKGAELVTSRKVKIQ